MEGQWLEGWLSLHMGPFAENVQVAEQALTSSHYSFVRILELTYPEFARAYLCGHCSRVGGF